MDDKKKLPNFYWEAFLIGGSSTCTQLVYSPVTYRICMNDKQITFNNKRKLNLFDTFSKPSKSLLNGDSAHPRHGGYNQPAGNL